MRELGVIQDGAGQVPGERKACGEDPGGQGGRW